MVTPIIFPFLEVQWVDLHNGERVCKTYGDAYEKKRNCHTGNAFILKNSNTTNLALALQPHLAPDGPLQPHPVPDSPPSYPTQLQMDLPSSQCPPPTPNRSQYPPHLAPLGRVRGGRKKSTGGIRIGVDHPHPGVRYTVLLFYSCLGHRSTERSNFDTVVQTISGRRCRPRARGSPISCISPMTVHQAGLYLGAFKTKKSMGAQKIPLDKFDYFSGTWTDTSRSIGHASWLSTPPPSTISCSW